MENDLTSSLPRRNPLKTLHTILYAEDDPDIQAIALLALETLGGFEVAATTSGDEAVRRIDTFQPDLILLDVMMPGMDGPTALRQLRNHPHAAHVPVIFMTAKVQAHEVQALLDLGAIAVISKPFDPMTLANELRQKWSAYHGQ